jgi:DNA-directed RNA polymerase specialized sigma subunit
MRYVEFHEIDSDLIDYLAFKEIAAKYGGDSRVVLSFKTFEKQFLKKLECFVTRNTYKYKSFSNYQDLRQDAFEAILLALNTFDSNKGSFSWWANQYIKTRVSRSANAHSTIRFPISKAKEETPFKVSYIPVIVDSSPSPLKEFEISQNAKYIEEAMCGLSNAHKSVVNMTFGCGGHRVHSIKNILELLGINRARYVKLLKESKNNIKDYFNKLERNVNYG